MKKLILLSGLFLTTTAFAGELHNYNDIVSAISSGTSLHFVTDFTQCTPTKKSAAAATVITTMSTGAFTPNEIGVTSEHIATALTHFTLNDPMFPGKPVNEFVRYTITPDNNMNVILNVLDPVTYASLLNPPIVLNCKIDVATKIYT